MKEFILQLPRSIRDAILIQSQAELPNECCGMLVGKSAIVELHIPLVNEDAEPKSYFAEPKSLFNAFKTIREGNLELLAIYHSHPVGEARPSRRDVEEWFYCESMMVIISLMNEEPEIRGWWVEDGMFREATIELIDR